MVIVAENVRNAVIIATTIEATTLNATHPKPVLHPQFDICFTSDVLYSEYTSGVNKTGCKKSKWLFIFHF